MRLAIAASHPIQYYAPLFRELARRIDLHVFYAHRATPQQQAAAGFGQAFDWDVDLASGYDHSFLVNRSQRPGTDHFGGCDTPEIGERLGAGGFDALLVFGWNLKSSVQAVMAAKRLGLPVMVRGDSQLSTPRSPLKRWVKALAYPPLLRTFDAALYVGRRSRAYYEHYNFPVERLFASPHCVDTEAFAAGATAQARQALRAELGAAPHTKLLLFAGKLLAFKRPLDVVEIAARLRALGADARMIVAGSGELEAPLAAAAKTAQVPLSLLGFRNQSAMPAAYAAADLLVLPSDGRETWGLVCNEALACGTPILVSEAVGCAPDLADGIVGRAFPTADTEAAAVAAAAILNDPPTPAALAAKSAGNSLAAAADGIVQALRAVTERDGASKRLAESGGAR
jgi:glycosyltransferase involved in cell wall biosynthesis